MGLIRLFLAMSVVIWHSGGVAGWFPYNGTACVILFFIISGFYMTLILNKKYLGPGSRMLFWKNRFYRLWPSFIIATAVTFPLMPHIFVDLYGASAGFAFLAIVLSNFVPGNRRTSASLWARAARSAKTIFFDTAGVVDRT